MFSSIINTFLSLPPSYLKKAPSHLHNGFLIEVYLFHPKLSHPLQLQTKKDLILMYTKIHLNHFNLTPFTLTAVLEFLHISFRAKITLSTIPFH